MKCLQLYEAFRAAGDKVACLWAAFLLMLTAPFWLVGKLLDQAVWWMLVPGRARRAQFLWSEISAVTQVVEPPLGWAWHLEKVEGWAYPSVYLREGEVTLAEHHLEEHLGLSVSWDVLIHHNEVCEESVETFFTSERRLRSTLRRMLMGQRWGRGMRTPLFRGLVHKPFPVDLQVVPLGDRVLEAKIPMTVQGYHVHAERFGCVLEVRSIGLSVWSDTPQKLIQEAQLELGTLWDRYVRVDPSTLTPQEQALRVDLEHTYQLPERKDSIQALREIEDKRVLQAIAEVLAKDTEEPCQG